LALLVLVGHSYAGLVITGVGGQEFDRISRLIYYDAFLASIDNAGCFEGDGSSDNPLRSELCSASYDLGPDGTVRPPAGAGLGVEVDETFIRTYPQADGPARQ
jgi:hypothetical protein